MCDSLIGASLPQCVLIKSVRVCVCPCRCSPPQDSCAPGFLWDPVNCVCVPMDTLNMNYAYRETGNGAQINRLFTPVPLSLLLSPSADCKVKQLLNHIKMCVLPKIQTSPYFMYKTNKATVEHKSLGCQWSQTFLINYYQQEALSDTHTSK